jgi:hypothetical protein
VGLAADLVRDTPEGVEASGVGTVGPPVGPGDAFAGQEGAATDGLWLIAATAWGRRTS